MGKISARQEATQAAWRFFGCNDLGLIGSLALVRNDPTIDFDWGRDAPAPNVRADGFSVRWTRTQTFAAGTYRFSATVDDGVRVWVDDQLILVDWREGSVRTVSQEYALTAGDHSLRVEYMELTGLAQMILALYKH